ncbi:MAG: Mur ligase family protein [Clostridiaceae bacterium]|jgi:UDP-N-acetylmuramyl tripeptide synthase|nr:Mur ligase family protein [Clostridiaceae bacterium]
MKKFVNKIRLYISLILAKVAIFFLRLFGTGGTSLPGKLALMLYPDILKELADKYRIILVTGTNGKTTTSRIIEQILIDNNISYTSNRSGANLISGLATTLIADVKINTMPKSRTALLEVDEAAFRLASRYMKPNVLVVTNFFRDQLDRYGELYSTLNAVKEGISNIPETTLILNADDSLCASLGINVPNPVIYYGMEAAAISEETRSGLNNDASFCLFCMAKYEYEFRTYGHLGHFKCPECGYSRPEALIQVGRILSMSESFSRAVFSTPTGAFAAMINLPGLYNIYNALAGVAFAETSGFPHEKTIHSLSCFESGFGRMESINLGDKNIQVILIKNPAGFNQVLNFLLTVENPSAICFIINDKIADGTDISWLWDADLEVLNKIQHNVHRFFVSGTRAEDMAVRLKYAGIYSDNITIENDSKAMLDSAIDLLKPGETLFILPTYTALLDIRKVLKKRFKLKNFWQ